jgi:hypothetical protein
MASLKVLGQQEFSRSAFELSKINTFATISQRTVRESNDLADWNEEVTTLNSDDDARDRGMRFVAHSCHEVLDASDAVSL